MPNKSKFYLTTAIPYVNARPHLGHALEFVQGDVLARRHRLKGDKTAFLSGTDDNALKNVRAAEIAGKEVQQFIDDNGALFLSLLKKLNVQVDFFQKGSDKERHYPASQELWRLCEKSGDIYKKAYEGLYCVGCELFYSLDELNENGECFEHPGTKLDSVSEENYFFALSRYKDAIYRLIESGILKIIPSSRKNEALAFLSGVVNDISVSRSNSRAKNWGVPVPGDDAQRIYVWFDALNIYQSGVGFSWDDEKYKQWWPADAHVIGKGILRFHAVYWPAFLLSAGLELPKSILVHGYITVEGQKMSKTLGNVIDPFEVIAKYGAEPLRYYLLREIPAGEDGDFSFKKLEDRYNGDLANGLGNLVSRVAALGEKISPVRLGASERVEKETDSVCGEVIAGCESKMENFRLNEALAEIWRLVSFCDKYINEQKPWSKAGDELKAVIINAGHLIGVIADLLEPFLPDTSRKIREQVKIDSANSVMEIKKGGALFPRL